MRIKLIVLLLLCIATPLFPQPITIDADKLEQIIASRIAIAVDEAVAVAVKAERLRFADIELQYQLKIIDLQATIDKQNVSIQNYDIIITNLKLDKLDLTKKLITTNLTIGGSALTLGFLGGVITYYIITR